MESRAPRPAARCSADSRRFVRTSDVIFMWVASRLKSLSWKFSSDFLSGISTRPSSECSLCRANSAVRAARSSGFPAKRTQRIGILYDVREENVAFIEFSRHFRRHGLPVPEIYAEDLSQGAYLEEDLGGTTLFEFLSGHREGATIAPEAVAAYRKVVAELPRFQVEAGRDLNYKVCYPRASFDRQSIAWDLNYFKYYFLRLAGIPFNEQALEDDFSRLTKFLLERQSRLFSLSRFPISQRYAGKNGAAVLSGLSGWPQRCAAIRYCVSFV